MKVMVPKNLEEALDILVADSNVKIVAGGTDILPRINQGFESYQTLCYINDFPEMNSITTMPDESVFVGASIKLATITNKSCLASYEALVDASTKVATPQIRNQGTIVGNLLQENRCKFFNNQVPWSDINKCFKWGGERCYQYLKSKECVALFQSDLAPALIAHNAMLSICSKRGKRTVPLQNIYLRGGKKAIQHDEIVLGVLLPPLKEIERSAYVRITERPSFDFPLISCAIRMCQIEDEITDCSIVFGSAGSMPAIFVDAQDAFIGRRIHELHELSEIIKPKISRLIAPFKDTRNNASTRRNMANVAFEDALEKILNRFLENR
jgi:CO/xanthine dehydrogenase FAD-binding subunit